MDPQPQLMCDKKSTKARIYIFTFHSSSFGAASPSASLATDITSHATSTFIGGACHASCATCTGRKVAWRIRSMLKQIISPARTSTSKLEAALPARSVHLVAHSLGGRNRQTCRSRDGPEGGQCGGRWSGYCWCTVRHSIARCTGHEAWGTNVLTLRGIYLAAADLQVALA